MPPQEMRMGCSSCVGSRGVPKGRGGGRGRARDDGELDHAAATARTEIERAAGELSVALAIIGGRCRCWRRRRRQQSTALGKLGGAMAVGEIAVVADAVEAVGQDVKQEATNELVGGERHDLAFVVMAIVLPEEADALF